MDPASPQRDRRCLAAFAVALLGVACGCSCEKSGSDAGADTGVDLGVDLGPDAGVDMGRDLGRDASFDGGPAGWTRLPGLPAACNVELASNPVGATGLFSFHPCPGFATGCRELTIDWTENLERETVDAMSYSSGYHDGTHGAIAFRRAVSGTHKSLLMAMNDDGAPFTAIRTDEFGYSVCSATNLMITPTRELLIVYNIETSTGVDAWIYTIDPATPGSATLLTHLDPVATHGNSVGQTAITAEQLTYALDPGFIMFRAGWDGTVTQISAPGEQTSLGNGIGDLAYFTTLVPPQITQVRGTGPEQTYIAATSDGGIPIFMDVDGHDVVWLLGHDPTDITTFTTLDVMTSPYSEDGTALVPRRLGAAPSTHAAPPRLGYGRVAIVDRTEREGQSFAVYRLADGVRSTLTPPPDRTSWETFPFYLGPEEMAVAGFPPASPPDDIHIWFVRYDAFEH